MTIARPDTAGTSAAWLVDRVAARTAAELGDAVAALIRSGELTPGTQLPTIRDIARAAGLSTGTVLSAWNALREDGLIETHRRAGTRVRDDVAGRFGQRRAAPATTVLDLAQNSPDITLQPELGEALLGSLTDADLNVFGRATITPRLLAAVAPDWPFAAESWATAGGGTEALLLATAAAAPEGSTVAVDEPLSPGFQDTLRDLGLSPVGVVCDEDGPTPTSLEDAVRAGAAAFVLQPGAPFAIAHRLTPERADALASVLVRHPHVLVVEDDSIGPLGAAVPPSIGSVLPDRVIRVRSYCRAYGIDIRTSVLGGARTLVERAVGLRSHGVGSNSRILQNALAHLIGSERTGRVVDTARSTYLARRDALTDALRAAGLSVHTGPDSLAVWVDVHNEVNAVVALAQDGVAVGAGSASFLSAQPVPRIRLSSMLVPDEPASLDTLVTAITRAALPVREYFD